MTDRKLVILHPRPGHAADWKETVRVAVPNDLKSLRLYVWSGDDLWHAQRPGQPSTTPEVWEAACTFGHADSFGNEFRLVAIETDAETTASIKDESLPGGLRSDVVLVRRQGSAATPNTTEKKGLGLLTGLIVAVVSAVLGVAGTYLWNEYSGRMRHLQYVVQTTPALVGKPDLKGKEMKLLIDGKPVENVSSAVIAIFNNTDQDFDDLPVIVTFSGPGPTSPTLIQEDVKSSADAFQRVPTSPAGQNSVSFGYNLKVVNRSEKAPVFAASYLFGGDRVPDVTVTVRKKGVDAAHAEIATTSHSTSDSIFQIIIYMYAVIGALAMLNAFAKAAWVKVVAAFKAGGNEKP